MAGILVKIALAPLILMGVFRLLNVFYFAGTFCESRATLTGKTVIVTGANTGLGKTTALDLAKRGARIILACRNEKRAAPVVEEIIKRTKNSGVVFMQLDLASFSSIENFARNFLNNEKRLDILINNAGMLKDSDEPVLNRENGIESTFLINHLGPFLLTNLLLDRLKSSGPGSRIVTVSSFLHEFANPHAFRHLDDLKNDGGGSNIPPDYFRGPGKFEPVLFDLYLMRPNFVRELALGVFLRPGIVRYGNSKLANVIFMKELAKRLIDSGVTTYVLHPGAIKTEIGEDRNKEKNAERDNLTGWLVDLASHAPLYFSQFLSFYKTLEGGAQTTICCAVDENLVNDSGLYYSDCKAIEVRRPEANDEEFSTQFWEWSQNVIDEALKINESNEI